MHKNIAAPSGKSCNLASSSAQLVYNGGKLLSNVEVTTIFWGSAWQTDSLSTSLSEFFDFVVGSPLIDQLSEYSVPGFTIGHGKHVGSVLFTTDPPLVVDDSQIQSTLQSWIANGVIPAPNANSLYFIFTPNVVTVTLQGAASCVDFCGYHSNIGANADGGPFYAVMPYASCSGCGGIANSLLDAMTTISSHELCEAITDPVPGAGWYDQNNGEIGDICEGIGQIKVINTAKVAASATSNSFNVSVSPGTITVDGVTPVNLTVTLTPASAAPQPTPTPTGQSWAVQLEWSNVNNACI